MFLATTANRKFWNEKTEILFLGEWCKLYKDTEIWRNLKFSDLEYHWNDNSVFENDFKYLEGVYESHLEQLAKSLNKIHGVDYSDRYWRIVVGIWLKAFIDAFYDRYLSIKQAEKTKLVTNTWITTEKYEPPANFPSFSHDDYNLYLYSYIIRRLEPFPYEYKNFNTSEIKEGDYNQSTIKRALKEVQRQLSKGLETFVRQALSVLVVEIYPYIVRKVRTDIIFVGKLYLSVKDNIILQVTLKQLPFVFHGRKNKQKYSKTEPNIRRKISFKDSKNEFEKLLSQIIPEQIPKIYVEDYRALNEKIIKSSPANPKLIITAFSINYRRYFEFWSAFHMEKNHCKIAVSQHGGGYGSGKCMALDQHFIKAFDRYYTWGSDCFKDERVRTMPSFRLHYTKKRLFKSTANGPIMWIATTQARYKTFAEHGLTGPHMIDYFKMQEDFYKDTNAKVKELLLWRYFHDPWDDCNRMLKFAPNLKIQKGLKDQMGKSSNFINELKKCRLAVHTANETTYIEALASNFPSIIYWDRERFVVHKKLEEVFDVLVTAEILHYSAASAARKVNEIYNNPLKWWKTKNVQNARSVFCNRLGNTSESVISEWALELSKLKNL